MCMPTDNIYTGVNIYIYSCIHMIDCTCIYIYIYIFMCTKLKHEGAVHRFRD